MTSDAEPRRILVVDELQEIHDSFRRIFADQNENKAILFDFETKFLESEEDQQPVFKVGEKTIVYELDHAKSGEQACDLVNLSIQNKRPYSVAFVDMHMPPGMDGTETTEALWEIDQNLHVVICTAYSDHAWEHVLDRLGHNDRLLLLKKPFESDEAKQLALALSEKHRIASIQERKVFDLGREVERRRRAEETMRDMAHRDALTQLPNRPYLLEKLTQIVQGQNKDKSPQHAVLFLDLDHFKTINDSLGHDAGDDLLNQVAARLKECVREQDTTGRACEEGETVRLGGDEFVVLLEFLEDPQDALTVAHRIVKRISEPFSLAGRLVNVGTSVGIAYIDDRVSDAHEALRNADTAMYRAKNSGRGQFAVFDQTMHEDIVARLELENQLRRAVETKDFQLNYQPIVNLTSGTIQGVEVLVRWTADSGRIVSPAQFIPLVEELGLISQLGEWVLEEAMNEMTELMKEHEIDDVYLGVNVSQLQLSDPFFLDHLERIIQRNGFDRSLLKIEMNESGNVRSAEQILRTLLELHDSGVGIQIDDFGKGQSSLTCFQTYPIEAVKIDRSFTASIATDHSHAVIARAIVQLAHHLNAKIVAEGVESANQLESLRMWGCDAAQGFLFSPPLTKKSLGRLLQDPLQSEGVRMLRRATRNAFVI
ncbi:MAG: EAL domain-containing protein [Rubripirellula sp.]|nr:EAL domain-containing protein [Rubripirellula sp.]